MVENVSLFVLAAVLLVGGGAWTGAHMMGSNDGAACGEPDTMMEGRMMEGEGRGGHQHGGTHDSQDDSHGEMHDDSHTDEMHARCHEVMQGNMTRNRTSDHAHGS